MSKSQQKIIYKHTCIPTGKSYIGQTSVGMDRRWLRHISDSKNSNFHFHNAIRKYGKDNFIHEILFETTDQNIINEKEIEYIDKHDTYNNGYNMNIGGGTSYGYKHNQKAIEKNRDWHLGKKLSDESIKKRSKKQSGKNHYKFKGYYHTPYGIFETTYQAQLENLKNMTIYKWCKKYPDKNITKRSIIQSPYLKSLSDSPLGKTFRDIGFYFEDVII